MQTQIERQTDAVPSRLLQAMRWCCAALAVCLLLPGCDRGADSTNRHPDGKLQVYVDSYPLAYFAERIVGDRAEVVLPVPGDAAPAFWRPSETDIAAYQQADLILLNGAGFAKWTEQVSLPESRTVDTSAGFRDRYIEVKDAVTHSHGPGGEHTHGGTASVTWLDFQQAAEQARRVHKALLDLLPDDAYELHANFATLEADLADLDKRMQTLAEQIGDAPLIASHPSYQYWTRRYKLNVESVDWDYREAPKKRWLARLRIKLEDGHPAKWIIWEAEPVPEAVQRVSELGLESVVFDPCANRPSTGDWLTAMQGNLEQLKKLTVK